MATRLAPRFSISMTVAATIVAVGFVVFSVFVAMSQLRSPASPPTPVYDATSTHAIWKQEVASRVATLTSASSPEQIRVVREALTRLVVTADDRDFHFQLILALLAFERGEPNAYASVQSAARMTMK